MRLIRFDYQIIAVHFFQPQTGVSQTNARPGCAMSIQHFAVHTRARIGHFYAQLAVMIVDFDPYFTAFNEWGNTMSHRIFY